MGRLDDPLCLFLQSLFFVSLICKVRKVSYYLSVHTYAGDMKLIWTGRKVKVGHLNTVFLGLPVLRWKWTA